MPTKSILLVEDNPDDRELMRLAFAQGEIPHNLIVVSNGREALNYLLGSENYNDELFELLIEQNTLEIKARIIESIRESPANRDLVPMPALIILDLNLPQLNGVEVLRCIRAHPITKLLPVVIISSSDEPQDLIDSYINGCNSYIRKPINFPQLQNFVKEISTYWLTINQLPPVFGVLNE